MIGQPQLVEDGFQHGVHLCVGASDLDGGQFSERGAVDPGDQEVARGKDDVGCGLLIDVPQRDGVAQRRQRQVLGARRVHGQMVTRICFRSY